jgi:hypothetical protein
MIDTQVNITKDGYNIQTDVKTFRSYYQKLGWKLVGKAPVLPCFASVARRNVPTYELTPEYVAELNANQGRLF